MGGDNKLRLRTGTCVVRIETGIIALEIGLRRRQSCKGPWKGKVEGFVEGSLCCSAASRSALSTKQILYAWEMCYIKIMYLIPKTRREARVVQGRSSISSKHCATTRLVTSV